jgi:hypothetical protein
MLRIYFKYDRKLLTQLCHCAIESLQILFRTVLGLGRLNRSRTIARFSAPHYEGSLSDSPIEGG